MTGILVSDYTRSQKNPNPILLLRDQPRYLSGSHRKRDALQRLVPGAVALAQIFDTEYRGRPLIAIVRDVSGRVNLANDFPMLFETDRNEFRLAGLAELLG